MFRFLLLFLLLIAATAVQTTFADLAAIGGVKPDLLLALAIYLALSFELREALIPIWGLGLFRDVFSFGPVGLYAFIFLFVGLFVGCVRAYAYRDNVFVVIVTVVLAVALCELSAAAVLSWRYAMPSAGSVIRHSAASGLYCSCIVLLLPRLVSRPCKWLGLGRSYE
jgi:rod shape-determining protein MreD